MKNLIKQISLCILIVSALSVDAIAQNFAGTYKVPNSKSVLKIEQVPNSKNLTATIKGVEVRDGGMTKKINLKGKYKLVEQGNHGEKFYLITLQGMGKWEDANGNRYPIAFTLSAFVTKDNPKNMTSQFAAAYEFSGNAEDIIGGILGWKKKS